MVMDQPVPQVRGAAVSRAAEAKGQHGGGVDAHVQDVGRGVYLLKDT
jgi:O-acetyl-ADP-ribose deacetylase (regulator of RNase III)